MKFSKANLRKSPRGSSPVDWVVGRYMPLLKVKKQGRWVQVEDFEGEKYWVFSPALTKKYQCTIVKSKYAYLYEGPSTKSKRTESSIAGKYQVFKLVDRKRGWFFIEDDKGRRSWGREKNFWRPLVYESVSF